MGSHRDGHDLATKQQQQTTIVLGVCVCVCVCVCAQITWFFTLRSLNQEDSHLEQMQSLHQDPEL